MHDGTFARLQYTMKTVVLHNIFLSAGDFNHFRTGRQIAGKEAAAAV